MKITELSISPDIFPVLLIAAGLGLTYTVYEVLSGAVHDMQFQTVYGVEGGSAVSAPSQRTLALPVVEASSPPSAPSAPEVTDDARIEAAFKTPVLAPPDEKPAEPKRPSLAQQLAFLYRPSIQGLGSGGVFIRSQFWSVGESVVTMPIRDVSGRVIYPRIKSISNRVVVLEIGGEELPLSTSGIQ